MKTKILTALLAIMMAVLLCSCGESDVKIDEKHFPDKIFRQYISDNYDITGDGYLDEDEISKVIEMYVNDMGIYYLDGIQYFTSLIDLDCSENLITDLECINECTQLARLTCNYNPIQSLDVSNCTQLYILSCYDCAITSLNVNKCEQMAYLFCGSNDLTTLDVNECLGLAHLSCEYNDLTSLDVSNCTQLASLHCSNNSLNSLDLSNCTLLKGLSCCNNNISILDISKLPELKKPGEEYLGYFFECDPDVEIIR